jgi:acylphosphatase
LRARVRRGTIRTNAPARPFVGLVGQMAESNRVRVIYAGNVQGVGFRATARTVARKCHVTGFVKNLPDGSVELVAEGDSRSLDLLIEGIGKEMAGYILDSTVERSEATGEFGEFSVRF